MGGQEQVIDNNTIDYLMTDNGNNTYTYDYTINKPGDITINILKFTSNKVRVEYFPSKALTGENKKIELVDNIDFNWGFGAIYYSVSNN